MQLSPVLDAVTAALGSLSAGGRVGVALSGGLDSLVLADAACCALGAKAVIALHVDHGLSPASAQVAREVGQWAARRELAYRSVRVEVPRRGSLEQAARVVRYRALEALAAEHGLLAVATAHTARDQAETVLLRILRGTGVAGLAAIAVRRGLWVRPLLPLPRSELETYARERGLVAWEDPMNAELRFARVRVRQQLLPALAAENPAIERALCRLAEQAAEWTAELDELARPLAERLCVSELARSGPAVRKRALALALAERGVSFEAVHLEAVAALIQRAPGGTAHVSVPGAEVVREYDALRIECRAAVSAVAHVDVPEPGVPETLCDVERFEHRSPRAGDRMRPARLRGRSRKLSDLFVDAKVPRRQRATARVVCRRSDGEIVWVEHLGWSHGST